MISQKSILKSLYKSTKVFNIYISRNLILKYIVAMIKTNFTGLYSMSVYLALEVLSVLVLCFPAFRLYTGINDSSSDNVFSYCINLKINQFSQ